MRNFEPVGLERRKYADLRDAYAPLWSLDRARSDFWAGENKRCAGSDGNIYQLLASAKVNDLGNVASLPVTGEHGDVVLHDGDALRYWRDTRGYVSGSANLNANTWVSFGDGDIGPVPVNSEIDPTTPDNSSWIEALHEYVRSNVGTNEARLNSVGYNRWMTTDLYPGVWWNKIDGDWVPENALDENTIVFPLWTAEKAASGYWPDMHTGCRDVEGNYYILSNNARNKRLTDAPQATQRIAITDTDYGNYIYQATADDFFYWTTSWKRWVSPSGTKFVNPDEIVVPPDPEHDPASGTTSWKKIDFITAPALRTLDPDKVSVKSLGAKGNGDTSSAAMTSEIDAINAAIRLAADERLPVYLPAGKYAVNAPVEILRGTQLKGAGMWGDHSGGATQIIGVHNGNAVVELRGIQRAKVSDLNIIGDLTVQPKSGISLGRATSASAGQHTLSNLVIEGSYSYACIYSQASEENHWKNIRVKMDSTSTGDYVLATSQDDINTYGYVGSSNVVGHYENFTFINRVDRPTAAVIYMHVGGASKSIKFSDGYLVATNGYGLHIKVAADAEDAEGPFTFDNVSGERSGVGPIYGVYLSSPTTINLRRLYLRGWNFYQGTRAGSYTLYGDNKLTLVNSKLDLLQSDTDVSENGVEVEATVNTVIESDETIVVRN